ncbi:MAG: hypothetical protein K2W95_02895 [Candidatus Obscuribacterales bacterium]|nr:hypothetical protein [Candidatus Obscuribacterales bacterium]
MSQRKRKGSAITEFGPSLFIFLILIFFPMMDLLGVAAVYCCGWYCNFLVTRELAVRTAADGGTTSPGPNATTTSANGGIVASEINTEFRKTGICAFIGVRNDSDLAHSAVYFGPTTGATGVPAQVTCTSSITAQPFLPIPFFGGVPGLGAPVTFTIRATRPREVTN